MVCPCCAACRCEDPPRTFQEVCPNCNGILSAVDGAQIVVQFSLPVNSFSTPTVAEWNKGLGSCCGNLGCPGTNEQARLAAADFWLAQSTSICPAMDGTYVYDISLSPCEGFEHEPETRFWPWGPSLNLSADCQQGGQGIEYGVVHAAFGNCGVHRLQAFWRKGIVYATYESANSGVFGTPSSTLRAAIALASSPSRAQQVAGLPLMNDPLYNITKNYDGTEDSLCEYDHKDFIYRTEWRLATLDGQPAATCSLCDYPGFSFDLSLQ